MGLLMKGRYLITDFSSGKEGILYNGGVYIKGDKIVDTGNFSDMKNKYPDAVIKGSKNQIVMPGLIDGHSHGCGLSFIQKGIPYDFLENNLIDWAYAVNIDPELDSMLSAVRHIKNGCTTLHHNNWGEAFDGSAYEKAKKRIEAYQKVGIRTVYSPGIRNKNVLAYDAKNFIRSLPEGLQEFAKNMIFDKKKASEAVDYYIELFEKLYTSFNNSSQKIILGPSWVQGLTDEFLVRVNNKSCEYGGLPIHIHVLQTPIQKAYGIKKYGKSLVAHLNDLGLVNKNLVCGHAVYLNSSDINLLASNNASITHHPSCNLAVRNGIAPVYECKKSGVNVALGIDDKSINDDEDAFMELRMIYYLHRVSGFNLKNTPVLNAFDVFKMGTVNSAKVCGLKGEIGAIKPDMKADLITLDLEEITNEPWISSNLNIVEVLIHRAKGKHVNTVVVDGEVVMENREFKNIDIEYLYKQVKKEASRGLSKSKKDFADKMRKIKPYYQNWYNTFLDNLNLQPFYKINSKK